MYSFPFSTNRSVCIYLAALVMGGVFAAGSASGQIIHDELKLLANDGAEFDFFGGPTVMDNGIIAIGANGDDDNGIDSGSVYLFDAATGAFITNILPNDGAAGDRFGSQIAIDKGILAVGALNDDDNGLDSGSVYLFFASTGAPVAKLLASDGAANDAFGVSVAISNGIVAVGAAGDDDNGPNSGSVYLFNASTGQQIDKLLPNDGQGGNSFGGAIAFSNGVLAIGATGDDTSSPSSGSAYVFDASTGTQIVKLIPIGGWWLDNFGFSIAIQDDVVAVGAMSGRYGNGSVYLFDATTGEQTARIVPVDSHVEGYFGTDVAIDRGVVAIGAAGDNVNGWMAGAVYLFDISTGVQTAKLLTSDGADYDELGWSIFFNNGRVAAGAVHDNDNGFWSGSAYVFDVRSVICLVDFTGDGIVDVLDFFAFVSLFAASDPAADLTGDGIVDVLDFFEFVRLFVAGCP